MQKLNGDLTKTQLNQSGLKVFMGHSKTQRYFYHEFGVNPAEGRARKQTTIGNSLLLHETSNKFVC